jgi:phage shock protein C
MSEVKKLYRNSNDKVIAGVCSGIAEYFELDVVLIRVAAVLLGVFTGGSAVLAYIILIFVAPEKPSSTTPLGKK